ncbi:MAG: tRNA 2-thiouridine(34) synthase MnmA [Burkholderiaceae bacterium]|nr:tRNA 2-thiouridine(34) synthase MnmA [Burkholderiaceae bacterium]
MSLPDVGKVRQRIVVGLSGGVDSAVTAYLLKQQGHEVVGIFMKNWEDDDDSEYCSSNVDFVDAAAVADVIGIEIEHVNFAAEYKDRVFAEFLREYQAGRTPNPDVLCNAEIKFKAFLDHAMRLGAEKIATGHYARVRERAGLFQLLKGLDPTKDQSYFLFGIEASRVPRLRFPLGELTKSDVRELARQAGLQTAEKRESMELCFVPTGDYRDVLRARAPLRPGRFVDKDGRDLGAHDGFEAYTIGQRRGLPALGSKHYVTALEVATATVVLGEREDLLSRDLFVDGVRWLARPSRVDGLRCAVQVRARHEAATATLSVESCEAHSVSEGAPVAVRVHFDDPQEALAPGQAAVFYDGDRVLGGGWISSRIAV